MRAVLSLMVVATLALVAAGCGGGGSSDGAPIVVTTNILGDIVRSVVDDPDDVEVVLPVGVDAHEFSASARQAEAMAEADVLVVNGRDYEEGLLDVIESSDADVFAVADHIDVCGDDPHVWLDPRAMAGAVEAMGPVLGAVDGAAAYAEELRALDAEIESTLAAVPADRRVLVTNHEALGCFAARYGFEVVATVLPSMSTNADASASDLEALAAVVEELDIPAVFGEVTSSDRLASALAGAVGSEVAVVPLFVESLGPPGSGAETYPGMLRTDASLIVDALT